MSEVRIPLRWFLLATVVLALTTCAPNDRKPINPFSNPCNTGKGKADRNAPIVCVDDTGETLSVDPDPINVHDVDATDRKPVIIQWRTRSGSKDLNVEIAEGCVTDVECKDGHCKAKTRETDASGARCKYDVWTSKHPRLDPEVIIVDCCDP
ncbi:MAG TPA: hypothetical protein VGQ36_02510 [Thermoanaerobaculia bacterium]|jgi:hypothetical protein|nr:hypothetical protein [Thermoanaerobaculia bacterium]